MTTTDRYQEIAVVPDHGTDELEPAADPESFDLVAFLDELARSNAANGEHQIVAGGTFALYPATGGGVVLVLNVEQGPEGMVGTMRKKLGPGLIRALQAFGENGANPVKLIAALAKGRKSDKSR